MGRLGEEFPDPRGNALQFRGEFFNALNHPDFGMPVRTLSSSNFGMVFGTCNAPRIGQVAACRGGLKAALQRRILDTNYAEVQIPG